MPTGLTHAFEQKDMDLKKWLIEDILRQFGVAIALRESDNMPVGEMREVILKDFDGNIKRYSENVLDHKREVEKILNMSLELLETELNNNYLKLKKRREDISANNIIMRDKYNIKIKQLEKARFTSPNPFCSIFDLAIKQLNEGRDFDFSDYSYSETEKGSPETYRITLLESVTRSLKYDQKKLEEVQNKKKEGLEFFDGFIEYMSQMEEKGVFNELS